MNFLESPSIQDDRGYNQVFRPSKAMEIRTLRRTDAIIDEMKKHRSGPLSVLELGCGTGEMSHLVSTKIQGDVTGVDLCESFVEKAKKNYAAPNLSYLVADLNSPTWEADLGRKFDFVIGNGILHHIYHHLDDYLPRIRQVIKPGGRMIFWEPNLSNPYVYLIFSFERFRKAAKLEPAEMAFTANFIKTKLRNAGFTQPEAYTRDFLLPNTPASLIQPTIALGDVLEKLPVLRSVAQSLFISAGI